MLDYTKPALNNTITIPATDLREDLKLLHNKLLSYEHQAHGAPLEALRNPEILEIFTKITSSIAPYGHYDCFSFAQAILHHSGFEVPTFALPLSSPTPPRYHEFEAVLVRASLENPDSYFAVASFQRNVVCQGVFLNSLSNDENLKSACSAIRDTPSANYMMLLQGSVRETAAHVHGMIVLGEDSSKNDLWILHRNDTSSPPSISKLGQVLEFWRAAYIRTSDRFIPNLSLLVSRPMAEIEPLPDPDQHLIEGSLSLFKRIDLAQKLNLKSSPYQGARDFYTACAKELLAQEPEVLNEIIDFLTSFGEQRMLQRIESMQKSNPN